VVSLLFWCICMMLGTKVLRSQKANNVVSLLFWCICIMLGTKVLRSQKANNLVSLLFWCIYMMLGTNVAFILFMWETRKITTQAVKPDAGSKTFSLSIKEKKPLWCRVLLNPSTKEMRR